MSLSIEERIGSQEAFARCLRTGIIFRNPSPHVKSIHAYFPSVVTTRSGRLLAAYALGEAFEAVNLRVHLAESEDGGQTWKPLPPPAPLPADELTSECARLSAMPDGELVLLLVRHDRAEFPHLGLANPVNFGFVKMRFMLARSKDEGRSWSTPEPIEPPLDGPAFELCAPITLLRDGRWLLPTSTWRGWDGALPNGNKMLAFISTDRGRSWPAYTDIMRDPGDQVRFWESKIHELPDDRLLAVAWAHDEAAGMDLPNQYALSNDGGATWTEPQSTGLHGQTLTSTILEDGRILSAYRRTDKSGLWLNLARLDGDIWMNEASQPLWGHDMARGVNPETLAKRFQSLRFGAPSITQLPGGQIFVAFWCYEDCVSIIRSFTFHVDA